MVKHTVFNSLKNSSIILLVLLVVITSLPIQAVPESKAIVAMQQDYPGLMDIYGDRIASQKAHYIFVVDVSSSMLPYESTVKSNFLQFLDAVPDGDQVSLIKMSDEGHTGFVGLLKCTELSQDVRSSIRQVVNGFHFNRNGSSEDGSDGFLMAKAVIDAINVVGSNDLTFVYMLTDFEYWTHKNKYDKDKENWASLQSMLPDSKINGMCKYGIELNSGSQLRQGAIFKNELDKIFGKVEYQSVGSAALLSNWFSHIASSVMSVKLNSLLKADWKLVEESIKSSVTISGNEVGFHMDATQNPLVNGAVVALKTSNGYYSPVASSAGTFPGTITVGNLNLPSSERSFFPSFRQMGGDEYEAKISFQSPYADEISRLQGVCGEVGGQKDALNLTRIESGTLPSANVWNSILPLWVWVVIILVIIAIIASFVYEYVFLKLSREWSVSVKAIAPDGNSARYNSDSMKAPFTFGPADSDLQVKDAPWAIKLYTKRYNPFTFRKSGYFLLLEQGTFADVQTDYDDEPHTISIGESSFLCAPGKSIAVNVRIKEKGKTDYKISLD